MAKRKRLTPANMPQGLETKSANPGLAPPIAQVAGASAAFSAARDLEDQMGVARAEGRLIVALPLEAIEESHLMRDRLGVAEPEMEALMSSLLAHGQRTAIEVEDLGQGRFGLISGWRRLTADAVNTLFAAGSRARRSKIRSFLRIHASLEDVLSFPTALSERLGLKLAEGLKNGKEAALRAALTAAKPATAEAEATILLKALSKPKQARQQSGKDKAVLIEQEGLVLSTKTSQTGFSFAFEGAEADEALQHKLSEILTEALRKSENYT